MLSERNLLVRVVHDMHAPTSEPLELGTDEPLRILFVFAEARGTRPLNARRERLALLQLFETEIYPQRRVVAHVLSHGVTRERLEEQIRDNGGYHIVHWSGHGHLNLLELAKPGGAKDHISGAELVNLFVGAGGMFPRLFFLGACHSGDILRVANWNEGAERHKGYKLWAQSLAHTLRGQRDAADAALAELKAAPQANAYWIARLYAARGDKSATFEWLRKACAGERQHGCDLLRIDRFLRGLRDDPRYAALARLDVGAPKPAR